MREGYPVIPAFLPPQLRGGTVDSRYLILLGRPLHRPLMAYLSNQIERETSNVHQGARPTFWSVSVLYRSSDLQRTNIAPTSLRREAGGIRNG
jgi:hypothetical protein